MKRLLACTFAVGVILAPALAPQHVAEAAPIVSSKKFKNCTALNKTYPGGLAKKGVKGNKVSGKLKSFRVKPKVSTKLYVQNRSLDGVSPFFAEGAAI